MTARVPFALVGVLLLVGSATFAGSLAGPTVSEPSVDRAMDRTEAATQSALREAVTSAATEAARNPLTVPASNPFGAAVSNDDTFRDSLRVRIYVAVRDRLDRLDRQRDDVTVSASLPATPTGRPLAAATDRVSISRAGPQGTDLRATVRNVTLTARRDGRIVGERSVSPTVTVPVPTLAVHDRVSSFERRLNAGSGQPGLGSRLTAKLYALTWARGYAQFGGAPISNVVANRHLALLTNGAVLSMQRAQFGQSDPRGRAVLGRATAHTALTDVLSGSDNRAASLLSDAQSYAGQNTLSGKDLSASVTANPSVIPEDETSIGINRTADIAFADLLGDLNETIDETYDARVQLRQRVVDKTKHVSVEPQDPESDWELVGVSRQKTQQVQQRDAAKPTLDGPWHYFEYHPRRVVVRQTVERRWNTSSGFETTVEVREWRGAVDVALVGRHDGGSAADRPVEAVHERGGPLDGPNLKRIETAARHRFLGGRSIDTLAVEGLLTGGQTSTATIDGIQPDGLYEFVYRDLRRVRERVRDLSITTTRGKLATFQVNPGARLADKLESRRGELLAVPDSYGSVPDRARFNAREAYLSTVLEKLQARADAYEQSQQDIDEKLAERGFSETGTVRTDYEDRRTRETSSPLDIPLRVETAPSYLTLAELDGSSVPTLASDTTTTPLVARNVNYFTVPYGDIAQGIVERILGPERVRLRTAVQTLESTRNADAMTQEDSSAGTEKLESAVSNAVRALNARAAAGVYRRTPAKVDESAAVVESALEPWETPVALGDAWTNGSAVAAIHREVRQRYDLSVSQSDRLKLSLRFITAKTLDSNRAQPPAPAVNETTRELKARAQERLKSKLSDKLKKEAKYRLEKVTGRTLSRLPAGLPLAPPIAPWVTTVNYWHVEVRGEYDLFAVSVPRGTPDTPETRLRYVRHSDTVSLDLDEDGREERLGKSTRISFRTQTSVAIAVPPGPRGVGDVDGTMDERSSGWPEPGR
ncbi:DUF7286 family protein [Salinibaculum rarum]|uniref:DUF7286 family protein n=1 Tax=Salinibaculum rarum TaxID=3058903 RepID=UPI00265E2C07|nr:hypothetical protein [Salinibaculum sp. KK48]